MNYYTREWYNNGYESIANIQDYYNYIKSNWHYYPDWFKEYEFDVIKRRRLIFHDSMIENVNYNNGNLIINMIGIDFVFNQTFKLVLHNASVLEEPNYLDGRDIVAEELYCDEDGIELHLLLTDDDITYAMHYTIQCNEIDLIYNQEDEENEKESFLKKILMSIKNLFLKLHKR